MADTDDFDYAAWRARVRADRERWAQLREDFDERRRLTRSLNAVTWTNKHPKWDERYVELLLLISEGHEQATTPAVATQLADRMGIELAADRGRVLNLMQAGYIDRFKHAKQAGQLYYFLTDAGRQFLVETLGES